MKGKSLSRVQLLATPWTTAYQAPPSMGFSRQEYWSGVPLLSLKGCVLAPGISRAGVFYQVGGCGYVHECPQGSGQGSKSKPQLSFGCCHGLRGPSCLSPLTPRPCVAWVPIPPQAPKSGQRSGDWVSNYVYPFC